jgi:Domain of unknown function (DUF5666)
MNSSILTTLQRAQQRTQVWATRRSLSLLAGLAGILGTAGVSLLTAVVVMACGGGDGGTSVASVGSGGTGSFTALNVGTITGFGSVYVNGVRFDDSSPDLKVSDEDGARKKEELRLGMVVKVQGSISTSGSATATSFMFDSELQGPVRSINTATTAINIIGQTVVMDANTVFDTALTQGFNSLKVGDELEVHGFLNAFSNTLQATLVELKTKPNRYKISGTVKNLQNAPTNTFQIGSETISFSGLSATDVAVGLANDLLIKVRLSPSAPKAGVAWQAARVRGSDDLSSNGDSDKTELEGLISAITSSTQFRVGTVPVNASAATFTNGTTGLVVGARVEVKGALKAGILVASTVEIQQAGSSNSGKDIQLKGDISSLDPIAKTFVLKGVTVNYATVPRPSYDNFNEQYLESHPTASLDVRGKTAPNSSTVNATRIKFN